MIASQKATWGAYETLAEQVLGFFDYVFAGVHQYFEVAHWADYAVISGQISIYESSGYAGLLLGGSAALGLVCLALSLFGAAALAREKSIAAEIRLLLFVWIGGSTAFMLLASPLPWARYYLPLLPAMILLVAYALTVIASALRMHLSASADDLTVLA